MYGSQERKDDEKALVEVPLVAGGNDFDYCVKLFLEDMELRNLAYHTRRWHRENLHYIKTTLEKLNLPLEPLNVEEKHFKQCILYLKRDCSLSPTTINHRIRSLKQLFNFLNGEGLVCGSPNQWRENEDFQKLLGGICMARKRGKIDENTPSLQAVIRLK
ncbi:MAG TPA: hypothetical protein VN426_18070 [Syntrophomonadaceae bacterium]|nr:hypothetical protein [Syntrophomonadaceae bacterium]